MIKLHWNINEIMEKDSRLLSEKNLEISLREDKDWTNENRKPSIEEDVIWIYADNNKQRRDLSVEKNKVGKWMIFSNENKVDDVWEIIRKETEKGNLGINSKVRTAKKGELDIYDLTMRVICVYTGNYKNKLDTRRVRNNLKKLGFTQHLCYKTDDSTLEGKYGHASHMICEKFQQQSVQKIGQMNSKEELSISSIEIRRW